MCCPLNYPCNTPARNYLHTFVLATDKRIRSFNVFNLCTIIGKNHLIGDKQDTLTTVIKMNTHAGISICNRMMLFVNGQYDISTKVLNLETHIYSYIQVKRAHISLCKHVYFIYNRTGSRTQF